MTRIILPAVLAALCPLTLSAQTMDAQSPANPEIVTVGTRLDALDVAKLSSPVSVLTETEIAARGASYVSDLLRTLPGISVNSSGSSAGLTQIRMRGAEASHTLVLIDGVEVSNPNSGEFDFAGLRASDIVRIEVLRGEQSALYGSDAIGGVISITTRAGALKPGYRLFVEAGSFGTGEGQVSAVLPIGEARLSVNGNLRSSEGYDVSGLGADDGNDSRSLNVGLNGISLGAISLSAKYSAGRASADFDEDTDFDGFLNDTDSRSIVDSQTARLDGRFSLFDFDTKITASARRTDTDTRGGFSTVTKGKRDGLRLDTKRKFGPHGISLMAETEQESYAISPNFAGNPANPSNQTQGLAADYRYSAAWGHVDASVRQDFNDRFDDATTWRVGGSYNVQSLGGRLRASAGRGVKNPSLIELFGFFPDSNFVGNPELEPETALGFNLGYTQNFEVGEISLDYFNSDLKNEIFTDFSSFPYLPRNRTSKSTREGVEVSARWSPTPALDLRGSATHTQSDEDGREEVRRPELTASAALQWQASEALSVNVSADHTGSQKDTNFGTGGVVNLDTFTLVSARLAYDVNDIMTLSLRGENLLDEDYQEVFGYRSKGRGLYIGLTANFE